MAFGGLSHLHAVWDGTNRELGSGFLAQGPPFQSFGEEVAPCPMTLPSVMHRPWAHSEQVEGRQAARLERGSTLPGAHFSSAPFPLGVVRGPSWDVEDVGRDKGHVL